MTRSLGMALFLLAGGFLLATHVSHEIAAVRQAPARVAMPDGWISTPAPSHIGYFRQTLEIPFRPKHAWISVAAEDYRLYVNEALVGENLYLLRGGTAYQDRLRAREQSLTRGEVLPRGGGATLARPAKREWRMVQFYDLGPRLREGRNTLALFVQSADLNRLAVSGRVEGYGGAALEISGRPSAWRASSEDRTGSGVPWFHAFADDLSWKTARAERPPEDLPLFAAADPAIWKLPFLAPAITGPAAPGDERLFRLRLDSRDSRSRGWLRVWSNWPYHLFVGQEWVGSGGGSNEAEAFDISAPLGRNAEQIAFRLHRGIEANAANAAESPWLVVDGRVGGASVSTADRWEVAAVSSPDWLIGGGRWTEAPPHGLTDTPRAIRFQAPQGLTWSGAGAILASGLMMSLVLWALALGLSRIKRGATADAPGAVPEVLGLVRGCWLLAPALLGVLLLEGLRFRFGESDTVLTFLNPDTAWLRLTTGPLILLVSLLWLLRARHAPSARRAPPLLQRMAGVPPLAWLGVICSLGLALRVYGLEYQPPSSDDYTSWAAAQGILRSGVPEAASGILYTRSPLFHYLLAGWLGLFGDTLASARSFSLLPGMGVIIAMYFVVAGVTRRTLPALATALVLAVDPWLLGMTNLIRFYQLLQFFAVLSVLFFLKGFIWREGKRWQNLFFLSVTLGVLSQEIFATTLAAFALAFLLFYRPFDWERDRSVVIGFACMMFVIWLDLRTYSTVSMTPHLAISSYSESLFVPHLVDIFGGDTTVLAQLATDFFWMNNGENAFWTALFFMGLLYWARHREPAILTLYLVVLVTLPILTLLLVQVNARYTYSLYPIFVAAAIISADAVVGHFARGGFGTSAGIGSGMARRWAHVAAVLLIATWAATVEFGKLDNSYTGYRDLDYRRAWEYVAANQRPGDKTLAVRPAGAGVVLGGIDYYAMVGPGFDAIYQNERGAVDRRAGGKLVWKVDQFRDVFLRHPRVWVVVDQPRWSLMNPGVEAFLRDCCSVETEFFGGQIMLWERSAGRFSTAMDQGGGDDSF